MLPALFALALAACAQTTRQTPSVQQLEEGAAAVTSDYVIGAQDVLTIAIWKETDLSIPAVEVRLDGKISVPLINDIQAAGRTPNQLKDDITERLKEYVTAPQVTVIVSRVGSKNVYILGEVARQGAISMMPEMRVLDAIAIAGGFTPFAGKNHIKIIRGHSGDPAEFVFDYDAFVDGADVAQNILLVPGDQIIVPQERPFWR
ncbi:MAG TPA: polysaccharide biosynthesis/export family protein [Myxococcota bacterium]|nr:polysaccharide biosynthesis/export family protein [Myxococcota bacterium]